MGNFAVRSSVHLCYFCCLNIKRIEQYTRYFSGNIVPGAIYVPERFGKCSGLVVSFYKKEEGKTRIDNS